MVWAVFVEAIWMQMNKSKMSLRITFSRNFACLINFHTEDNSNGASSQVRKSVALGWFIELIEDSSSQFPNTGESEEELMTQVLMK